MACSHPDIEVAVVYQRLTLDADLAARDEVKGYYVTLHVFCTECEEAFGFRTGGTTGFRADVPSAAADALALHVPLVSPDELELLGADEAVRSSSGLPARMLYRDR